MGDKWEKKKEKNDLCGGNDKVRVGSTVHRKWMSSTEFRTSWIPLRFLAINFFRFSLSPPPCIPPFILIHPRCSFYFCFITCAIFSNFNSKPNYRWYHFIIIYNNFHRFNFSKQSIAFRKFFFFSTLRFFISPRRKNQSIWNYYYFSLHYRRDG